MSISDIIFPLLSENIYELLSTGVMESSVGIYVVFFCIATLHHIPTRTLTTDTFIINKNLNTSWDNWGIVVYSSSRVFETIHVFP